MLARDDCVKDGVLRRVSVVSLADKRDAGGRPHTTGLDQDDVDAAGGLQAVLALAVPGYAVLPRRPVFFKQLGHQGAAQIEYAHARMGPCRQGERDGGARIRRVGASYRLRRRR